MTKPNLIKEKCFKFVLSIVDLYKTLLKNKEFVISKQLLSSASSIGANIAESEAAQSNRDFMNKLSIASKEARETKCWLEILQYGKFVNIDYSAYLKDIDDIINILTRIVKTCSERYR